MASDIIERRKQKITSKIRFWYEYFRRLFQRFATELKLLLHVSVVRMLKALVTLSRLGGRPLPTLMVCKGLVGGRERAVTGLVRS